MGSGPIWGILVIAILGLMSYGAYRKMRAPETSFVENYAAYTIMVVVTTIACVNLFCSLYR